jgi:hypothetical protein
VFWPARTVKETVAVAPTTGTVVVVEVEGVVEGVVEAPAVVGVVVLRRLAARCCAPEQLAAPTATATTATTTIPVVALFLTATRRDRRWRPEPREGGHRR